MDRTRFDCLTRSVSLLLSRRTYAGILSLSVIGMPGLVEGKKKRKKRRKKKKIKLNAFGCVDVGGFCKNSEQCCSGICQGKKDKKTCQGHDQRTCLAGQRQSACGGGGVVPCQTALGEEGFCDTTTGNAAYCSATGNCAPCTKDADCIPLCGPNAACIQCTGCAGEPGDSATACVGPEPDSCSGEEP